MSIRRSRLPNFATIPTALLVPYLMPPLPETLEIRTMAIKAPRGLRGYLRGRSAELARPATRAAGDPLADWCLRRIRLEGRPFSFSGHEYLRAIYDDPAPHIVLSKAAQIGGTVWAILRSIHACSMGLNVIYFFPTRTDVLDFSRSRIGPMFAENPFLRKLIRDTDTMGLNSIFRWEIEPGREFFVVMNYGWLQENSRLYSWHRDIGVKVRWTFRF